MKLRRLPQAAACLLACISLAAGAALPTVPTPPAQPVRSFAAAGLLQAGFGLAVVIGLIFLFAWVVRRFGLQTSGNGRLLKVVSSAMVGQRERVVVVEIGDAWLVLGVAAGQVRALHTMPAQNLQETPNTFATNGFAATGSFSQKLLQSMNQLGKRN
ncbi:MAG: flagellar biosynthetic protein FliO [Polaromonas sp.]